MIYVAALNRLPYDEEESRDYRAELVDALDVASWSSPLSAGVVRTVTEGPAWWHGDEDASQSFLGAMGVVLE